MKVKKLKLSGYKRFQELVIDLGVEPKRIVALVGPNGCGKSSVLDSMLYLNNAYDKIGNKPSKEFAYHSMLQAPDYSHQKVEIQFDRPGDFYDIRTERMATGDEKTIFSFRSPYRYNNNVKITAVKSVADISGNNYGATTTTDIDDKMEDNYRRLNIKYNKYLNDNDCRPSEAKAAIISELNSSIENCLELKIDNLGDIEDNRGILYFKKNDHPIEFEFNVLSSGEKEVVDILLDLYLRKEKYYDTIFLIDEPELHINTSIQRKLLIEINKLIGENCQIWITTHSIGFLRALQEELKDECQVIEFKKNIDWASTTQVLMPINKSRRNWIEIFETALDDLTGLVSPKTIIYCEGRDRPGNNGEERGFDAKVFNNIFNEKYHDSLFISSGGNTELDQRSEIAIAILSKVFSDIEIVVLKDRDMSSGRPNSEADRLLYLENNPSNHRVLKRWEIENYLFDKEVLQKFCLQNNLQFSEDDYDSYVTDIVNANIKDETNRIKNFCNILTSVNAQTFKLQLSKLITSDMVIFRELESCIFERG